MYRIRIEPLSGQAGAAIVVDATLSVAQPQILPAGGTYISSVTLTMSCPTVGAEIRYATNGTIPTQSSLLYTVPFTLTPGTYDVRAKAFKAGLDPSTVTGEVYTVTQQAVYQSHPPDRLLPSAANMPYRLIHGVDRPLGATTIKRHISTTGNDGNDGSIGAPWLTLNHAEIGPNYEISLRGGRYDWRTVGNISGSNYAINISGAAGQPLIIRSYPGETVTTDFGHEEFILDFANQWEVAPGGASHEYRSINTYADPGGGDAAGSGAVGRFGDSYHVLFSYKHEINFRSNQQYREQGQPTGLYSGPGLRWFASDQRFHVRLARTTIPGLTTPYRSINYNYSGETDPRNIPLVIPRNESSGLLAINGSHVHFLDIFLRGQRSVALNGSNIRFESWAYQCGDILVTSSGNNNSIYHSFLQGVMGPWTSRFAIKNHGGNQNMIYSASGDNLEIGYSWMVDAQDGIDFHNTTAPPNWDIHHNYCDNFCDDFMNPTHKLVNDTGIKKFRQNYVTGVNQGFGYTGGVNIVTQDDQYGMFIYRNTFDLRRFIYANPPLVGSETSSAWDWTKLTGSHGATVRPNEHWYHNVIASWRGPEPSPTYMLELGNDTYRDSKRWVLNNLELQVDSKSGVGPYMKIVTPSAGTLFIGGNVHYSAFDGSVQTVGGQSGPISTPPATVTHVGADIYVPFGVPVVAEFTPLPTSQGYEPAPANRTNDPVTIPDDNFRLIAGSPAIGKAVPIPATWPDVAGVSQIDPGIYPSGYADELVGPLASR